MDAYSRRRVVSWIAHYLRRKKTWRQILAINAEKRDKFPVEWLRAARPEAEQCVRNAQLVEAEFERRRKARAEATAKGLPPPSFPPMRLCDLPGCDFKGGE